MDHAIFAQVTYTELVSWIGQFIWPLFRVAAFLAAAPIFGEIGVSPMIKLSLAVLISVAISPLVGAVPLVDLSSGAALGMIFEQIIIGTALGMTMRLVFSAVSVAGELIGLQMGLSLAQVYDISIGGNASVISKLLSTIALLVFVAVNGHLLMVSGLAKTFAMVPIGGDHLPIDGVAHLLAWSGSIISSGLLLSMPMVVALLAVNLIMGIMNRAAQQLSIFSIGFPITLGVSLLMLTILLPRLDYVLEASFLQGYEAMSRVAEGFSSGVIGKK